MFSQDDVEGLFSAPAQCRGYRPPVEHCLMHAELKNAVRSDPSAPFIIAKSSKSTYTHSEAASRQDGNRWNDGRLLQDGPAYDQVIA